MSHSSSALPSLLSAAEREQALVERVAKLEAAINNALQCTPYVFAGDDGFDEPHIRYECGDPWDILRTALANAENSDEG